MQGIGAQLVLLVTSLKSQKYFGARTWVVCPQSRHASSPQCHKAQKVAQLSQKDTDVGVTAHHTQAPSQKDTDVGITAHHCPGPITEGHRYGGHCPSYPGLITEGQYRYVRNHCVSLPRSHPTTQQAVSPHSFQARILPAESLPAQQLSSPPCLHSSPWPLGCCRELLGQRRTNRSYTGVLVGMTQ